jgi:hypothetical protein
MSFTKSPEAFGFTIMPLCAKWHRSIRICYKKVNNQERNKGRLAVIAMQKQSISDLSLNTYQAVRTH